MPKKHRLQLCQDLFLTVLLTALFGYHLWAEPVHEWLGLTFLALICSHTGLNVWWFKRLFSQKYSRYQAVKLAVNLATLLLFITACITGILLSKHLFAELFFHTTNDSVRKLHLLSTHWLQIAAGVHLGLHWQAITSMLANHWRLDLNSLQAKVLLPIMWTILSLYGVYVFFNRDLLPYLLNQVNFAFFNYEESPFRFYFDFGTILIAVAYCTHFLSQRLLFSTQHKGK